MAFVIYDGRRIPIGKELVLGRWRGCDVQVRDDKASRRHARLLMGDDEVLWIEDLGSANGTSVNDQRLGAPHRLAHGDRITIGRAALTIELDEREASSAELVAVAEPPKPALDPQALIGEMVGGCRLLAVIGSGAGSTVYRAKQVTTGREVAVRVLANDLADEVLERVRAVASIRHDSLVGLHDCGREKGHGWCSMELIDGDNLERLIERDGELEPALALLVCERVALALEVAHTAGIAHGDVNPRTVLLSKSGQVKVVDLGLGGDDAADPAYAAPDRHGRPARPADDVYALGGTLYHLLAGAPPFTAEDPEELARAHREQPLPNVLAVRPGLPAKVVDLLNGMLNKNPDWRYATMREVVNDLRPLRDQLGAIKTKPKPKPVEAPRPRPRPRTEPVTPVQTRDHAMQRLGMRLLLVVSLALIAAFVVPVLMRKPAEPELPAVVAGPAVPARTPKPVPVPVRPTPVEPSPSDDLAERWDVVQERVARDLARDYWGAAERQLAAFAAEAGGETGDAARLRARQLALDGGTWYHARIAELPALDQAGALPRAATALGRLRDVALASDRPDAESRYQEVLARLTQRLAAARRDARRAIEARRFAELTAIAETLRPDFAGTPIEGLHRQFAALASEAAAAAPLAQDSWAATRAKLRAASGPEALAAGAALLLAGEVADAKAVLAQPALAAGDLLRRRERLLGREAAVLSFDDPNDLQFVEELGGPLVLADGALSSNGDAGVACSVPVGGRDWEATLVVALGEGDGQAVLSLVHGDTAHLSLRIEKDSAALKVHAGEGWTEQAPERPRGATTRIRCSCRDGRLEVAIDGLTTLDVEDARIPAGSQLRFEAADLAWKLDELQVVGGD
ncbi:MAG TPA: FHA domain-containing serine/threonine-protein kinase [Planctomycetota bacterium]|nr:FHA domain-containing serine/threonine-protein kinase [Planctomycetota bacterium]